MLEEVRIRGLGVIADAALPLGPGLTVITGETGAGKTMILQALGLLFGGRADPGRVRAQADRATVQGLVRLAAGSPAAARAEEVGAQPEEPEVGAAGGGASTGAAGAPPDPTYLITRVVEARGRARATIGGAAVPAGVLAELAADLLAVHGQADQLRLLRPAEQRDLLDRFAGEPVGGLRRRYEARHAELLRLRSALAEHTAGAQARQRERDGLSAELVELAALHVQPGEEVTLRQDVDRLAHADLLAAAAGGAHQALDGDASGEADARTMVGLARQVLRTAQGTDPRLDDLAARLDGVAAELADVAGDLGRYAAGLEADPARLAAAQERLATLTRAARRRGTDSHGLIAWQQAARDRLDELSGDDERVTVLADQLGRARAELADLAAALSAARRAAADDFAAAVSAELAELAMPDARVLADVRRREVAADAPEALTVDARPVASGPAGVDDVEILLMAHPGAPARPVQRGASGGELSRVMLAVEVVLAGADPVPTLVFDEVDAGVGGRAAVEVGRRLARLAGSHQVLVVTHLAQVAAFADAHVRVLKQDDGTVTASGVAVLDGAERVRELSRMLAGLEDSGSARAHASELLDLARADRADRAAREDRAGRPAGTPRSPGAGAGPPGVPLGSTRADHGRMGG